MGQIDPEIKSGLAFELIFHLTCLTIIVSTILIHLKRSLIDTYNVLISTKNYSLKSIIIFTLMGPIFFIMWLVITIMDTLNHLVDYELWNDSMFNCNRYWDARVILGTLGYGACAYLILLRLKTVFEDSAYKISEKLFYFFLFTISFMTFGMCIVVLINENIDGINKLDGRKCKYKVTLFAFMCYGVYTVFLLIYNIYMSYIFGMKLNKIILTVEITDTQKMQDIRELPIKYTLLCVTASSSTVVAFFISLFIWEGPPLSVDYTINTICLLLMTKYWKEIYIKVCKNTVRKIQNPVNVEKGFWGRLCSCGTSEDTATDIVKTPTNQNTSTEMTENSTPNNQEKDLQVDDNSPEQLDEN